MDLTIHCRIPVFKLLVRSYDPPVDNRTVAKVLDNHLIGYSVHYDGITGFTIKDHSTGGCWTQRYKNEIDVVLQLSEELAKQLRAVDKLDVSL